jgi:arylsulfatase A-like enzyme
MNRREFLGTTGVGLVSIRAGQPQSKAVKPNIILILADDLGYGDLGCYGQKRIKTPNLDRMAAEGMRFIQAYAGSTVCAPSRCCLMTGLHTGHARTRGNKSPDLPLRPQDITVTEILKAAGYRTGLFGKWSLGELGSTGYPRRKGFDQWFGYFSQVHAHNYYPEHLLDNETAYLLRGNFGARKTEYAHDLFTERSLAFVKEKDERPFFLHVSYTIPHANNEVGRDTGDGMEVPGYEDYENFDWPKPEKGFAAMVSRMDRDVGRLLDELRETGRDRDTLVIFTSDNGPHKEGGHAPDFFESRGPLRGIKRALYEGGIRVPTIAWWPGTIQPAQTNDAVWAFWDFLPTCCDLAGSAIPSGLDGRSIVPVLEGKDAKPADYLYWEFHEQGFDQGVRMGDWKGVRRGAGPIELYDLRSDLSEASDISSRHPDITRKVDEIMRLARTESPDWPVRS